MYTDHDVWITFQNKNKCNPVYHIERAKVKSSVVGYLRLHKYIPDRALYLCKACISMTEYMMKTKSDDDKNCPSAFFDGNSMEYLIDRLITFLSEATVIDISDTKWVLLFYYLGKRVLSP